MTVSDMVQEDLGRQEERLLTRGVPAPIGSSGDSNLYLSGGVR